MVAWTSMHFAVGMAGGAVIAGVGCLIARRGYKYIPAAMTVGGLWAFVPDMPRLFREDFPSLPFAATLGDKGLERWLHSVGDLFFFHQSLDAQPREFALHGLFLIIMMYNLAIAAQWFTNHRAAMRLWRNKSHSPAPSPTTDANQSGSQREAVVGRIRSSHLHRTG